MTFDDESLISASARIQDHKKRRRIIYNTPVEVWKKVVGASTGARKIIGVSKF